MKIIIPGEPQASPKNRLLTTDLFRQYAESIIRNQLAWESWRRVQALRRSCGVESRGIPVEIRVPPRYLQSPE
jgi:hypothetical protein